MYALLKESSRSPGSMRMGARRLPVPVLAHAALTIVGGSDISPGDAAEVARAAGTQAEAGAGDKGAPASEDAPEEDDRLPDEVTASVSLVSDYVD